uniref:Uncharacterized protein n=1 Tax=Oryza sativa subsp. japonica TaxID=39947 RepID=Q5Z6Q2_ORYSJ|nr:hypothetical protein [Oryza sativa Japonica Group]
MRSLSLDAESAERFAVLTAFVESAAEAVALVAFVGLVAQLVAGLVVQPAESGVSVESATAVLDQQQIEAAETWRQPDLASADSQPAHYAVAALSSTTEGSPAGLVPMLTK